MSGTSQLNIIARIERWPLKVPFVIARGSKSEAIVVVVEVVDRNGVSGRGECVPYARYGETPEAVVELLQTINLPTDRSELLDILPAGAARNALDCALWDYDSKRNHIAVTATLPFKPVTDCETAFTLSLASPQDMAAAAKAAACHNLLKLKLGGADSFDKERMAAVRQARPDARLIGDANEGWSAAALVDLLSTAHDAGFEVIEQPLPAGDDALLTQITRPVPVCADESHHNADDLDDLIGRYDAVNIKLDKAGGLTSACKIAERAQRLGFDIMIGSMVATSLAIAPAYCLVGVARWVDLDGPLLLADDRQPGFMFDNGRIAPPRTGLWGEA